MARLLPKDASFICVSCGDYPQLLREDHDGGEFCYCSGCDKFLFKPDENATKIWEKEFIEVLEFIAPTTYTKGRF